MKKAIGLILICIIAVVFLGCSSNDIDIEQKVEMLTIDYEYELSDTIQDKKVFYKSTNNLVLEIDDLMMTAVGLGICYVKAYDIATGELIATNVFEVKGIEPESIEISCEKNILNIGDAVFISTKLEPAKADQLCVYISSDESVIKTSAEGKVLAVSSGIAVVTVKSVSYPDLYREMVFIVNESSVIGNVIEKEEFIEEEIADGDLSKVLSFVIDKVKKSIVGVNNYIVSENKKTLSQSATGIVYKEEKLDNGKTKYYVLANKHIVYNANEIEIYYEDFKYQASLIACDTKVDLAVITFEAEEKYEIATFGDSDNIKTGQFILAIGNTFGDQGFHTTTFGVISYPSRYVSSDTDGDGVGDWDALYVQHDAATSDGMSGGAIVDLNGNIIAINTTKIIDSLVDNMGFAIPANYVMQLASSLEKGIVPQRPVIGVTGVYVANIMGSDYYFSLYGIPKDFTYGMYIQDIDTTGIAYKSGIRKGDILLTFNGEIIKYSHVFRALIGEYEMGSNAEAIVEVYRNGEIITLKVVF